MLFRAYSLVTIFEPQKLDNEFKELGNGIRRYGKL